MSRLADAEWAFDRTGGQERPPILEAQPVCTVVRDHGGHAHPCGQDPDCPAGPGDCCAHCRYETATGEEA